MHDYIGALKVEPGDKEDSGVKGMKWGVRRDRSTLRKEAAKRAASTPEKKPATNPDGSETSAARYARLAAEAKAGKSSQLSDTDLKFFNARTEALSKINKLNETKPGWLAETTKSVLQTTAKNQMQSVSDALANKYVGNPIKDAIAGLGKDAAKAAS